ncbi:hypothetical protein CR513_35269, partial [Mucuna pruriens]
MATKTGYGIQKIRPIHARTLDLVSLRQCGSHLKGQWCRAFEGKYDNLLGLLGIKGFLVGANIGGVRKDPGMPLARSPPYLFKRQYPSWAAVSKLLRMFESEIKEEKKSWNSLESIPQTNLEGRLGQLHRQGDYGAFMDVFGLLIYDIVLFPYIEDHIDLAVVDIFLAKRDKGENPMFWLSFDEVTSTKQEMTLVEHLEKSSVESKELSMASLAKQRDIFTKRMSENEIRKLLWLDLLGKQTHSLRN